MRKITVIRLFLNAVLYILEHSIYSVEKAIAWIAIKSMNDDKRYQKHDRIRTMQIRTQHNVFRQVEMTESAGLITIAYVFNEIGVPLTSHLTAKQ